MGRILAGERTNKTRCRDKETEQSSHCGLGLNALQRWPQVLTNQNRTRNGSTGWKTSVNAGVPVRVIWEV